MFSRHETISAKSAGIYSMPNTEQEIIDLIKELESLASDGQVIVYLEKVHAMPGQGVTSMFTFGHGYGFLRGVIQALGIKLVDVTPQKWQKELGMIGKDKDAIYQFVRQTYPTVKCNKKQADAMGILHYALAVTYLDKQKEN